MGERSQSTVPAPTPADPAALDQALDSLAVSDPAPHHGEGKGDAAVGAPNGTATVTLTDNDALGADMPSPLVEVAGPEDDIPGLLGELERLTELLAESPYDLATYLNRACVHATLGYSDLGASDAYRALLLADEAMTEGFEYHDAAREALSAYGDEVPEYLERCDPPAALLPDDSDSDSAADRTVSRYAAAGALRAYQYLTLYLLDLGCLASTATYLRRGLGVAPTDPDLVETKTFLEKAVKKRLGREVDDVFAADLPDTVLVRREVYPWNTYEPDRNGPESLATLNATLRTLAPKCAVQVAELPVLDLNGVAVDGEMNYQLGVFATEDIAPGEVVLSEYSLLTANNRHKDMVCEACSSELPRDRDGVVNCPECYDATFCSQWCLDQASERYHPAVCGTDVDEIAKDPDAAEADESLHLLLLARVLAIAEHEDIHPLDVAEVKFIWGDFTPFPSLPFSFKYNVEAPLHILETMDVDIYASPKYDTWVLNTLYAKTRGTASARKNPRDGRPDVAAVHTYWCLANHDCDPNVSWDWAGRMVLRAREERITGEPGIRKGEEILNHYCDVTLPVQQRREWAKGPLGGWCMCKRCCDEAAAEAAKAEAA